MIIVIDDHLGKFHHDLTLFSRALEIMVYIWGIIPIAGRTIQVSEILQFTQQSDNDTVPALGIIILPAKTLVNGN